ncbi:MAG: hypothetical protein ACLS3C_11765 [Oscillospiraceae bacterium]
MRRSAYGIGGLPDGAEASRSAVQALLTTFHTKPAGCALLPLPAGD